MMFISMFRLIAFPSWSRRGRLSCSTGGGPESSMTLEKRPRLPPPKLLEICLPTVTDGTRRCCETERSSGKLLSAEAEASCLPFRTFPSPDCWNKKGS